VLKDHKRLLQRADRCHNLAVIDENIEETLHIDKVMLQLERGHEGLNEHPKKEPPRSVDVLLKKQEMLSRELERLDKKKSQLYL
jgi:hypothetical protein